MKIILAAVLAIMVATANAEETTHGDWTVRCKETCEMYQKVFRDEEQTQRALMILIGYPAGLDSKPGMMLVLPLGISLPPGTFIQIDDDEPTQIPVERCERDGCRVVLQVDDRFLDKLKDATSGFVIAHDRQRQRFHIPFSLNGFSAALDAL